MRSGARRNEDRHPRRDPRPDQRYAESLEICLLCYLRADVAMHQGEVAVVPTGIN
jgi:hypothetical protein